MMAGTQAAAAPKSSMQEHKKIALLIAAALLRLGLFVFFPNLPELLGGRVEIATPMTGFKRCMPRACYRPTCGS